MTSTRAPAPQPPSRRVRHDDLRRDVGAGPAHRLDQPRPGLPRHRRPRGGPRGGGARAARRPRQPVPAGPGHPRAAHGDRRAPAALVRPRRTTPTPRSWSPPAPPRPSPPRCSRCVEPGDEVIALEPYYDSYAACIAMAGGTPRPGHPAPRRRGDRRFRLDLDELRDAVTDRTRLLLLNTPHNPTGTVLTRDGAHRDRRARASSTTCSWSPTRSTSTSSSTGEHIPLATLPGHARAHGHDLLGRQDVLLHRLEGRLGHRVSPRW